MATEMSAAAIEWMREYFAARQPEWTVTDRTLRAYLDESSAGYILRESIDIDMSLEPTPEELERHMLLEINKALLGHVRSLMKRVQ